jgi:ArsR family transcriptional regulator
MAVDILTHASSSVNMFVVRLIQQIDECCPVLLEAPLAAQDAERLASALKVLADPARLRLVSLIAAQPDAEACVCNLTAPLGLSQPTVSHHLRVLNEAGVLERERRGKWVYYRLNREPLDVLARALSTAVAAAVPA